MCSRVEGLAVHNHRVAHRPLKKSRHGMISRLRLARVTTVQTSFFDSARTGHSGIDGKSNFEMNQNYPRALSFQSYRPMKISTCCGCHVQISSLSMHELKMPPLITSSSETRDVIWRHYWHIAYTQGTSSGHFFIPIGMPGRR